MKNKGNIKEPGEVDRVHPGELDRTHSPGWTGPTHPDHLWSKRTTHLLIQHCK